MGICYDKPEVDNNDIISMKATSNNNRNDKLNSNFTARMKNKHDTNNDKSIVSNSNISFNDKANNNNSNNNISANNTSNTNNNNFSTSNKLKSNKEGTLKKTHTKIVNNKEDTKEIQSHSQIFASEKEISIHTANVVNQQEGSPAEHYIMDKKLGEGSYGEVYRVRHKTINVVRAMKKINRKSNNAESEKEIVNEINLLKKIDHPNVVKIFEFYQTKLAYYILTEMCSGGELFDNIIENAPYDEPFTAYIMYQVLSSVLYCHNMNILHRDLKPENILIESVKPDGLINIKVIDFGTAKIFENDKDEQKVIGSAYYIAPEVLKGSYNEKCDLWSCGVILYIMLTARPPFGGSDSEIASKIRKGKYDKSILAENSPEVVDLISKLLELDPKKRYNAAEALSHEWFVKLKIKEKFNTIGYDKLEKSIKNLKKFRFQGKIQEAALAYLVHNSLHLGEVKDIYQIFHKIDQNSDGKISKNELRLALMELYQVPDVEKEVNEIFANVDNDNNGYIEYEEFIRACLSKEQLLTEEILRYTFNFFDKDKSGEISFEEIRIIFGPNTDETVVKNMILKIDQDNNNEINFEEFSNMMMTIINEDEN